MRTVSKGNGGTGERERILQCALVDCNGDLDITASRVENICTGMFERENTFHYANQRVI